MQAADVKRDEACIRWSCASCNLELVSLSAESALYVSGLLGAAGGGMWLGWVLLVYIHLDYTVTLKWKSTSDSPLISVLLPSCRKE